MIKLLRFLSGVWAGANILAFPVAFLWLYMSTGKVVIPCLSKGVLAEVGEAAAQVDRLVSRIEGAIEGGQVR